MGKMLLIFSLLAFVLILVPFTSLFWVLCGKLYKIPNLTFSRALKIIIVTTIVSLIFNFLDLVLERSGAGHIFIHFFISIAGIATVVWVMKKGFATTLFKTIALYISTIGLALCLALFIKSYMIQAFRVPAESMAETIRIGDHILVHKFLYGSGAPGSGDIVVFAYPEDPSKTYLKRIVGVGGETVEIKNKNVLINGKQINEPYVIHKDERVLSADISTRDNMALVKIPEDAFFVMGDHRDNSHDSRFWGFVQRDAVAGKAFIIYWSQDKTRDQSGSDVRWNRIGNAL
ncbi:MAG: signal peptidase I [Desulfobacter sp.]